MTQPPVPPLLSWQAVHERLKTIFPEGLPERPYFVREMTAKAVFTALYVGAVEGSRRWLAPRHVVRMNDARNCSTRGCRGFVMAA